MRPAGGGNEKEKERGSNKPQRRRQIVHNIQDNKINFR